MQDFRNLKVWEKAHALTLDVYRVSKSFPREEMYGIDQSDAKSLGCRSVPTSLREYVGEADVDLLAFSRLQRAPPANWSITCFLQVILSFMKVSDYQRISEAGSRGEADAGVAHAKAES